MNIFETDRFLKIIPLVFLLFLIGCNPEPTNDDHKLVKDYSNKVIWEWNELLMQIEKDAMFYRPGPAPRAVSYMAYSAYEICLPGMVHYRSLRFELQHPAPGNQLPVLNDRRGIHYPLAINASYGLLMHKFFENAKFLAPQTTQNVLKLIKDQEQKLEKEYTVEILQNASLNVNNSKAWGQEMALAIWAWSQEDALARDAYVSEDKARPHADGILGEGFWQTYNPGVKGMFSYWGDVYSFAVPNTSKLINPTYKFPINYADTSSEIYDEMREVYDQCEEVRKSPTGNLAHIAQFWSDDVVGNSFSPPIRFVAIADQVFQKSKCDLEKTVVCMAKLGLALNDAGVCAWKNKYAYNIERPISMIRRYIDPNWNLPWLESTPAFPAWPSGHSTFGWAGATILAHEFGNNINMYDSCHINNPHVINSPRFFENFTDMAHENAESRIPLGVHFRMDAEGGERLGKRVGNIVLAMKWKK